MKDFNKDTFPSKYTERLSCATAKKKDCCKKYKKKGKYCKSCPKNKLA